MDTGLDTPPTKTCPACGSTNAIERETHDYTLEDGTLRRITYCTACMDEKDDGTLKFEVIAEKFIRTNLDVEMNDDD